jgi:hypothetical protein
MRSCRGRPGYPNQPGIDCCIVATEDRKQGVVTQGIFIMLAAHHGDDAANFGLAKCGFTGIFAEFIR